jgi:hypothetical protein
MVRATADRQARQQRLLGSNLGVRRPIGVRLLEIAFEPGPTERRHYFDWDVISV